MKTFDGKVGVWSVGLCVELGPGNAPQIWQRCLGTGGCGTKGRANFFIDSSLMIIVSRWGRVLSAQTLSPLWKKPVKRIFVVVDELGSSDKWRNIAKRACAPWFLQKACLII